MKKAFITGITGQDGSYLAELLLKYGYEVHGLVRRSSSFNRSRIEHLYQYKHEKETKIYLHYGDVTDSSNIQRLIVDILPDEVYNLAAQSHVAVSFETPEYTANTDALGALRILEVIRSLHNEKKIKFYQASTSELFGKVLEIPQNEKTPFNPCSPYGVAKLYSYFITKNYREAYDLFTSNGILFNHESPRRGENFVTRKITLSIAKMLHGLQDKLYVGNLDAKRDWGYAPEYVKSMWLMLQKDNPDDYVISTGEMHSVREFIFESFNYFGIEIEWIGEGEKERGIVKNKDEDNRFRIGDVVVVVELKYFRPAEVDILMGDSSKAEKELKWKAKTKFKKLVGIMAKADYNYINELNK